MTCAFDSSRWFFPRRWCFKIVVRETSFSHGGVTGIREQGSAASHHSYTGSPPTESNTGVLHISTEKLCVPSQLIQWTRYKNTGGCAMVEF